MKIELPDNKTLVHEMSIPIRWGDMDTLGHVNNTVYFRYMEISRIEWLSTLRPRDEPAGRGAVIVNAFCNFMGQLGFPGDVRIRLHVSNAGRSSFDSWVVMERTDDPGVVYASGGATIVWVDYAAGKSVALPDWLRLHLE